jgi:SAM-dependent methyltransferase
VSKLTLEEIRAFWTEQAVTHGPAAEASWSDLWAIDLEIREISGRLPSSGRVLDVGCANGFSTFHWAARGDVQVRGLDYIPDMIDHANRRLEQMDGDLRSRITFDVGDIGDLKEPSGAYDAVVVIRVLINLRTWEHQVRALRECIRVTKPGGILLLSEATVQGWQRLNALRREWGLTDIPMPGFNEYLDEDLVREAAADEMDVEVVNFASTYFVGTRVLKPLLAQAAAPGVDAANPRMEWNRMFSQLPGFGDYGTQKLFVMRKRA